MSRLEAPMFEPPTLLSAGQLPPPPTAQRRSRVTTYFISTGWLHLTLLAMAVIFLFPFAWMVGMSLKTDEEATSTSFFPSVPHFRQSSPYVRPAEEIFKPADVSASDWKTLLPQITRQVRAVVDKAPLPASAADVDTDHLRAAATQTLTSRAIERIDKTFWTRDPATVAAATVAAIGEDEPASVVNDQLAQLKLFSLQVRSLDGQLFTSDLDTSWHGRLARDSQKDTGGAPVPQNKDTFICQWSVEAGDAHLIPSGNADVIQYHFNSASDAPVVLRAEFPFPIAFDDLHRIILALQGDDSWHRIDAELTLNGQRWTSDMSYYVAQFRGASIFFQPPGRLESLYAPRTWIPLKLVSNDASKTNPNIATLRLTLRPSSTVAAIYGKVQRNYVRAFRAVPFWLYVRNSVILVVMQLMGALFSSAFVAYAFARLNWPGRSIAFGVLLSTMMLPSQITMIPGFLIWKSLGFYNTLTPLWFGAWLGNAFFIFLMTQHMKTIPKELDEAARIDGLNAVQTWWYIIVPQVKPTLAAIAIMTFMGAWNEFMGPLIMLRDQGKFPLSLGLFGMKLDATADWTMLMAGNIIMILPVVVIFFCFQRYFIEGVTVTGVKG